MSANAHKPIIAILILLVASFSSAHAAPHSGASAINLAAPPPPSPNSYPAALYTVGSQRKLLLIRQLFTPEHVLYTPFPSSHPESGEEPQHRCLASAWAPIGIAPGPRANRKEPNYFLFADRSARTRLPFAF